jgi:hypothetical protein
MASNASLLNLRLAVMAYLRNIPIPHTAGYALRAKRPILTFSAISALSANSVLTL